MRKRNWAAAALWLGLAMAPNLRADDGLFDSSLTAEACPASCERVLPECCDCFHDQRPLLGMLPSDHCFDRFISPLSNPFFFEDPRSLTEARGIFIDNSLPRNIDGGDAQVWAGQFRGRLTERLSVIAPRLGYLQVNQSGGDNPTGFLSVPVGFKYNFFRDVDRQWLASAGATYFIPGSSGAIANIGSGDFHLFLTGGAEIFDRGHWLSASGFRLPADPNWGTQFWYWSNQWDYEVVDHWYGLAGVNWYHWMRDAGYNIGSSVTGLDFLNLPVVGVAGTNVVSTVVGGKWKPNGHVEMGLGFEVSVTDRTDILRNRLYADMIVRY